MSKAEKRSNNKAVQLAIQKINDYEDIMIIDNDPDSTFSARWDSEIPFDAFFPRVEAFLTPFNAELERNIKRVKVMQELIAKKAGIRAFTRREEYILRADPYIAMFFYNGKPHEEYPFTRPLTAFDLREDAEGNEIFLGDDVNPLGMIRINAGGIVDFVLDPQEKTNGILGWIGKPYHQKLVSAAAEYVHHTSLVSGIPVLSKEIVITAFGLLPYRQQKGIK